jgi:hypothetical protein
MLSEGAEGKSLGRATVPIDLNMVSHGDKRASTLGNLLQRDFLITLCGVSGRE